MTDPKKYRISWHEFVSNLSPNLSLRVILCAGCSSDLRTSPGGELKHTGGVGGMSSDMGPAGQPTGSRLLVDAECWTTVHSQRHHWKKKMG